MPLLPILPPHSDETTVSWCSRIARYHAGLTCTDWLEMMEISKASVTALTDKCVTRLSSLAGVSRAEVLGCGAQSEGERLLRYKCEIFGSRFMTRAFTTYCPKCLLDDAASEANGARVGRLSWMFATNRVCPHHGIVLTRRKNKGNFERFQSMDEVAPSDMELREQAEVATSRGVSPLQAYVASRLKGAVGSGWMDMQRVDQAARACEMLGVCRLLGAHNDIDKLELQQWDEAGAVGMEAASKGPEGIRGLLEEILMESTTEKRWGGPQSALGRIYQWLQFNKSRQDPGPIKEVVRDFVVDYMPVEPGTDLFGEIVAQRKRHTVATLSKVSGLHQKTLNRALTISGLLPYGDPKRIEIRQTFDATAGEALAQRMINSTPIKSIPYYLNCNRTQAQMMVKNGILRKLADSPSITGGLLSNVADEDLDDFLRRFRAAGRPVTEVSQGMKDVIVASEIARLPVADIVALVLKGRLSKVETADEFLRFRSVFVDTSEVRSAAAEMVAEQGLSFKEAAKRIGINPVAIEKLRTTLGPDGLPFLNAKKISNARGTIRYCYGKEDVDRFCEEYVTLQELADRNDTSTKSMGMKLARAGVEPIMHRKILKAKVFRRNCL